MIDSLLFNMHNIIVLYYHSFHVLFYTTILIYLKDTNLLTLDQIISQISSSFLFKHGPLLNSWKNIKEIVDLNVMVSYFRFNNT